MKRFVKSMLKDMVSVVSVGCGVRLKVASWGSEEPEEVGSPEALGFVLE